MGIERYAVEAGGLADELVETLDDWARNRAVYLWRQKGDAWLERPSSEAIERALGFLEKTPAQRNKVLAKLGNDEAIELILHARRLALLAQQAMTLAERLSWVVGSSYRKAARSVAEDVLSARLFPCATHIVPRHWESRMDDDDDGVPTRTDPAAPGKLCGGARATTRIPGGAKTLHFLGS